jgi:hypothetical protein
VRPPRRAKPISQTPRTIGDLEAQGQQTFHAKMSEPRKPAPARRARADPAGRCGSSAGDRPLRGHLPPRASSAPRHTMWMPRSCSWNDMAGTSTPYELPGAAAAGPEQRPPGRIRSHHSHGDHSADSQPRRQA